MKVEKWGQELWTLDYVQRYAYLNGITIYFNIIIYFLGHLSKYFPLSLTDIALCADTPGKKFCAVHAQRGKPFVFRLIF